MSASSTNNKPGVFATHRKARRDYQILQTMEAGIALHGSEVKSIREGRVSLDESYARIDGESVFLCDMHVLPYEHTAAVFADDPRRPRQLLLHRAEIRRMIGKLAEKGLTLIPLKLYAKRGRVKVELALCRGKHHEDKRENLKKKTADREMARELANSRKFR